MILSDSLILPISRLQTQRDDVQKLGHIEYLIYLLYSCAIFLVEIDEEFSLNGGVLYDLIIIRDSGLLFWATLYVV